MRRARVALRVLLAGYTQRHDIVAACGVLNTGMAKQGTTVTILGRKDEKTTSMWSQDGDQYTLTKRGRGFKSKLAVLVKADRAALEIAEALNLSVAGDTRAP